MSKKNFKVMNAVILIGGATILAHRTLKNLSDGCIMKESNAFEDDLNEFVESRTILEKAMCLTCDHKKSCILSTAKTLNENLNTIKEKVTHKCNCHACTGDCTYEADDFEDNADEEDAFSSLDGFENEDLPNDNIEYEESSEEDFESSGNINNENAESIKTGTETVEHTEKTKSEEKTSENSEDIHSEEVEKTGNNPLKDSLGI